MVTHLPARFLILLPRSVFE